MTIASTLTIAPPAGVLAWALASGQIGLVWVAVPVGLLTGWMLAWGLGQVAIRQLEQRGPERLQRMRTGPNRPQAAPSVLSP
ncbi:hypothetical protein [Nocardia sp. NBC_01329]|uniref:hypothetical protein n=1 Tax=Nocardia sp. NBC_01329 TaxID=2903594 RepID=UPI002E11ACD8|nr:hypothetical protein OG405_09560 [Nocardia sp. NBC_01329]